MGKSGEVLLSAEFTPQALVEEAEKSVVVQSPEAETKDVAKAESEDKKKKDVVKVEVEEASKTDAGKVKDLDVSKKPDAAAKPKHIFEAGRLIITVFKARDIEKKGMFGKADPYLHITLGKQKAKSKTVKNNHNPEWNLDATFEVDQNTPETMRVDVFDEDLGKDDILGHKVLDISTVLEKKKLQNEWIPLDNCKSGEILLSAEFIPIANIQQSKQVEEHVEEQPTPDKPEEKDTKPKETVQDSEKSKTIKNNYNPEWEFNAKFNIKKDAAEGIKISVFDDDIGKDDALGMKVLDIGSVQDYQQLKNQWI